MSKKPERVSIGQTARRASKEVGRLSLSAQRGYKIRSYVNGKAKDGNEHKNYSLTVPSEIAEALPKGLKFVPRMTDDGLLYVPIAQASEHIALPAWAKSNGTGSSSKVTDIKNAGKAKTSA